MDILFVCHDAQANSVVDKVYLALEAKAWGMDVAILITEEATRMVSGGVFHWPPELTGQDLRWIMADNARAMNLPIKAGGEARQIDPLVYLQKAIEDGIAVLVSSLWTKLLGIEGRVLPGLKEIEPSDIVKLIAETKNTM